MCLNWDWMDIYQEYCQRECCNLDQKTNLGVSFKSKILEFLEIIKRANQDPLRPP